MHLPVKLLTALKFSALKLSVVKIALTVGLSAIAWGAGSSLLPPSLSSQGAEVQGSAQATSHGAPSETANQVASVTTEQQAYLNNLWPRVIRSAFSQ